MFQRDSSWQAELEDGVEVQPVSSELMVTGTEQMSVEIDNTFLTTGPNSV